MARRPADPGAAGPAPFDAHAFLESAGVERTVVEYARGGSIFRQGDAAGHVHYIRSGTVKLSVQSKTGREAVVSMLGPGHFFGEACLAGQPVRLSSATATTPSTILEVAKARMQQLLHDQHAMSDRFIAHMLVRNIRTEEDLVDQLLNSSEKRLARVLLVLARYGQQDPPARRVPRLSRQTLAEMAGTTRSRVDVLLSKFKAQGFIDADGRHPITVNDSLLTVVLRD